MSMQSPVGTLDIKNATLRVGKLEVSNIQGVDTALNVTRSNAILIYDDQVSTTTFTGFTSTAGVRDTGNGYLDLAGEYVYWGQKLPNSWVMEFEMDIRSGTSAGPLYSNIFCTSNVGGDGYTFTFNDNNDKITLKYDGTTLTEATVSGLFTASENWQKVAINYERGRIAISIGASRKFFYQDIERSTPYVNGEYVNFSSASTDGRKIRNLKITNGTKWTYAGESNVAFQQGSVGIGVTDPAYTLDVGGDINLSGSFYQGGSPFVSSLWTDGANSLYYRSNVEVGTANLFVDTTTSNVGIRTTTPAYELDVSGNVHADYFLGDGSQLTGIATDLESVSNIGNTTSNTIQFTNAATGFVTESNVGIANTNPQNNLDVGSNLSVLDTGSNVLSVTGNVNATSITIGDFQIVSSYGLDHVTNENNQTTDTIISTNTTTGFNASSNIVAGGTVQASKIVSTSNLEVGTANLFVDTTTSNVGIGTNTPDYELDVVGNVHANYFIGDGSAISAIQSSNVSDFASNVSRIGALESSRALASTVSTISQDLSSNASRITSLESGNMSISGDKTFTGDIIFESNIHMNGGNVFVANTVNMSVSDPIIELGLNNIGTNDLGIIMTRPAANSNVAVVFDESVDILRMGYTLNGANDSIVDLDSNALAVSVQGALSAASVSGDGSGLTSLNASNITTGALSTTTVTIDDYLIHDGDTDTKVGFPLADTFAVNTAGSERLRVDSSGNVGIGTASPATPFNINKLTATVNPKAHTTTEFIRLRGDKVIGQTYAISGGIKLGGDTGGTATADGRIEFYANDGADPGNSYGDVPDNFIMCMRGDGNVGIGTVSPEDNVHIYSSETGGTQLKIENASTSGDTRAGLFLQTRSSNVFALQFTPSTEQIIFDNKGQGGYGFYQKNGGGTTNLSAVIDKDGNVGIGTASPTKSLEIDGTTLRHAHEYRYQDYWTSNNNQTLTIPVSGGSARGLMFVEAKVIQVAANSSSNRVARVKGMISNYHTGNYYMTVIEGENVSAFETYMVGTSGSAAGTFTMKYRPQVGYLQNVVCRLNLKIFIGGFTSSLGSLTRTDAGSNSALTAPSWDVAETSFGGNVGIGTTNPAYTLDVNGSSNASSYYALGQYVVTRKLYNFDLTAQSASNFYPIFFDSSSDVDNYAPPHFFSVSGRGLSGSDTYNDQTVYGYCRGGAQSDHRHFVDVKVKHYDESELRVSSIYKSDPGSFFGFVVYVRGGYLYNVISDALDVYVKTSVFSIGGSTFAIKDENNDDASGGGTSSNIKVITSFANSVGTRGNYGVSDGSTYVGGTPEDDYGYEHPCVHVNSLPKNSMQLRMPNSESVVPTVRNFPYAISGSSIDSAGEQEYVMSTNPWGVTTMVWRNKGSSGGVSGGWSRIRMRCSSDRGYVSTIFVQRSSGTSNGGARFYHGCSTSNTKNLDGTNDTNPYFHYIGYNTLPQGVWCLSVGFIHEKGATTSNATGNGGIYRLDTMEKVSSGTSEEYKFKTDDYQDQRAFFYDNATSSRYLDFWNPGFYDSDTVVPELGFLQNFSYRLHTENLHVGLWQTKTWYGGIGGSGTNTDVIIFDRSARGSNNGGEICGEVHVFAHRSGGNQQRAYALIQVNYTHWYGSTWYGSKDVISERLNAGISNIDVISDVTAGTISVRITSSTNTTGQYFIKFDGPRYIP